MEMWRRDLVVLLVVLVREPPSLAPSSWMRQLDVEERGDGCLHA